MQDTDMNLPGVMFAMWYPLNEIYNQVIPGMYVSFL